MAGDARSVSSFSTFRMSTKVLLAFICAILIAKSCLDGNCEMFCYISENI